MCSSKRSGSSGSAKFCRAGGTVFLEDVTLTSAGFLLALVARAGSRSFFQVIQIDDVDAVL